MQGDNDDLEPKEVRKYLAQKIAEARASERKEITEKLNRQWSVLLEIQRQRMEKETKPEKKKVKNQRF